MTYYISITGLNVKSVWHLPKFLSYTMASKKQAEAAEGNIKAELHGPFNGIYHTMTVWKDRKSMTRFFASGAHAKAMKITQEVSSPEDTKTYGYETEEIPTWEEAYELWKTKGTYHGKPVPTKKGAPKKESSSFIKPLLLASLGGLVVLAGLYHTTMSNEEAVTA